LGCDGFSTACALNGVILIKCDTLNIPHAFSTRIGGVSEGAFSSLNLSYSSGDNPEAIKENYRRFFLAAGLSESAAFTRQVHETNIFSVSGPMSYADAPECDGLYTETPNLTLCGRFADCVPILLYDPKRHAAAVVHSGWRGTAAGICGHAVKTFTGRGSSPADITAAIFPAISPCCFTMHDIYPFSRGITAGFASKYICSLSAERFSVDLKGICAETLSRSGVKNIYVSSLCTCCEKDLFFSHRRTGLPRGGMAACICLCKEKP